MQACSRTLADLHADGFLLSYPAKTSACMLFPFPLHSAGFAYMKVGCNLTSLWETGWQYRSFQDQEEDGAEEAHGSILPASEPSDGSNTFLV